ncbi:hypothetical protein Asphe3_42560 (plasmid) [Pseudarthrobacter phenanthrenivorans Sphe3]|uniref:BPL/LPL catalytic domain-containing protein n=2 Tax=Micrococcales TaxID=85006 RepID=F0MCR5_PSEPM|nr:hypothetical protein Arth_4354 [Arthrobacter sp. FB24]ADX75321.1 hypothetical protein Asphe3_42560 [Pseudarthrobacter phenanthrenivorans Sphe3]WJH26807.1 hypothetical protein JCQ34_20485 [Pseudarthrobacter defluvii]
MRPCWELHVEPEPRAPLDGVARDLGLVSDVSAGRRGAVMRLWQPDRTVVLVAEEASRTAPREDVPVVARPTPGGQWLAAGPAAILWSTIATRETLGISGTEDPLEAASEWVLASLRQLGMQVSLQAGGTIWTPMGVVGACAVVKQDGVILAQGIVDYAMDAGDCVGTDPVPAENVRSQSGLPLPLVIDRFARMARTLFRAKVISPASGSALPRS